MGTYSIRYPSTDFSYGDCAVDWSWNVQDEWARSEKQGPGSPWIFEEGLDEKAYRVLLKHFGLEQYADEFPPERIVSMSPNRLAGERRKKEIEYQLPRKTMVSDTLGHYVQAEYHDSEA